MMKKITSKVTAILLACTLIINLCIGYTRENVYADEKVVRDGFQIINFEKDNHKYEFVSKEDGTGVTWYEAEEMCEKWGGHLATVTSEEEQANLQKFIRKELEENEKNNYWIGGYRDTELNEWKWVTGEPWDYTNWAYDEPNNYGGYIESYAQIIGKYYSSSKTVGRWNDASDSGAGYANDFFAQSEYGFICEYDEFDGSASYRTGTIMFPSYVVTDKDISTQYFYRDDYFMKDSTEYNPSLATMSLCLELSAWGSNNSDNDENRADDPTGRDKNVINLLEEQLGYEKVETNSYQMVNSKGEPVSSKEDSIAYALGYKRFLEAGQYTTVVAIAIRGGNYGREWVSNLVMGNDGEHQGFSEAANKVTEGVRNYISQYSGDFDSERVVFWITGYSRGGAVANLLAGNLLNGNYDIGIDVSKENMYAYCFEPAQGALQNEVVNSSQYDCIFNIVNPNDIVTYLAPSATRFGFAKYGRKYILPEQKCTGEAYGKYKDKMMENLKKILGSYGYTKEMLEEEVYSIDQFKIFTDQRWLTEGKVDKLYPMSSYVDEIIKVMSTEVFESRENYVNKYQNIVSAMVGVFMSDAAKEEFISGAKEMIIQICENVLVEHYAMLIFATATENVELLSEIIYEAAIEVLFESDANINSVFEKAGITFEGDFITQLWELIHTLVTKMVLRHPVLVLDLIRNVGMMFEPHYPENTLAWLQTFDSNYMKEVSEWTSKENYRKVAINCPVDVSVCNEDGKVVAKIVNDEVQNIEDGIVAYIDLDGQKVVCIPSDISYRIEIVATDNGNVTCSIAKYDYETFSNIELDNFYDIAINKGDVLKLNMDRVQNDDTVYTIEKENETILADESFSGVEAAAEYAISVVSDGHGNVTGATSKVKGEYAKVKALADEGYKFDGWYENGDLISTEIEYRFMVNQNVCLEGKFIKDSSQVKNQTDNSKNGVAIKKPARVKVKKARLSKKKVHINWYKAKNATKYIVQYSSNKKFKGKNVVSKTTRKKKINLKRKSWEKQYVRVRGICSKKGVKKNGKWSKIKRAK